MPGHGDPRPSRVVSGISHWSCAPAVPSTDSTTRARSGLFQFGPGYHPNLSERGVRTRRRIRTAAAGAIAGERSAQHLQIRAGRRIGGVETVGRQRLRASDERPLLPRVSIVAAATRCHRHRYPTKPLGCRQAASGPARLRQPRKTSRHRCCRRRTPPWSHSRRNPPPTHRSGFHPEWFRRRRRGERVRDRASGSARPSCLATTGLDSFEVTTKPGYRAFVRPRLPSPRFGEWRFLP